MASASACSSHVFTTVGGGDPGARIHAHVERTRVPEAEAARRGRRAGASSRRGRAAGRRRRPSPRGEQRREVGERAGPQADPVTERRRVAAAARASACASRSTPSSWRLRRRGEQRRRMTREPYGRIDETGTRPGAQPPHDLPHHHRHMGGAHRPDVRLPVRHRRIVATHRRSAARRHTAPPLRTRRRGDCSRSRSCLRGRGQRGTPRRPRTSSSCSLNACCQTCLSQMRNLSTSPVIMTSRAMPGVFAERAAG